ncbi:MAG: thioredoxin domain-containing protein [endosymbiont of Galathealinum brachiosum]|uniref:Thioredoxin domain-containing protein n=1 Tax=endosymbiont of Galathealinum brachiosum TaxID=2200906 RepID=A0A370DDQ5_9GAMM|nr:MAG: thioredoxin domain-containing protein [endosymbiont of Galathealinum brachiosum]
MNNPDNNLQNETSPYLLQHADNPVNWYPWNNHSLELAKSQNKPILLSIGYSACHWCHVMAHESFEDTKTARIMNQNFINIKVDREERPDLDKIYQTAHSLLTSRAGGWPLTVFLSPQNQMPFFAGTYFPDKPRYNMPAFSEIMHMVTDAYKNKQDEIQKQDISIQDILKNSSTYASTNVVLNSLPLDLARKQLESAFDTETGGFSDAPKFPHPDMLEHCLRYYLFLKSQGKNDSKSLHMLALSLDKMALGGFQDQIGGGFFRYSTDEYWMVPHFEKMLYDNAQLLNLYTQAYLVTHNTLYKQTIESTADWIIREIQTSEGGYCSALDADTEKVEGKTYLWTPQQIKDALTDEEFNVFEKKYNLAEKPNLEDSWHLHSNIEDKTLADALNMEKTKVELTLQSARQKLLSIRNTRSQPGRDDKILCAWNALMVRGMAQAGRRLNNPSYISSAFTSAEFIYNTLWKDKRLLVSYKDGKAHLNAYLDDYAYLLQGILELLQCQWSNKYYEWAIEIADSLLTYFEDNEQGGFFFTSHDHEQLLYRSKTFSDDAMPNGNAVAASALIQLGLLSGNTKYLQAAEQTIRSCYSALSEQAISHCSLLHALELYLKPGLIIVLRGTETGLKKWQQITNRQFIPQLTCVAINNDIAPSNSLNDKKPNGDICAYICEGTSCLPVITHIGDFKNYIQGLS